MLIYIIPYVLALGLLFAIEMGFLKKKKEEGSDNGGEDNADRNSQSILTIFLYYQSVFSELGICTFNGCG